MNKPDTDDRKLAITADAIQIMKTAATWCMRTPKRYTAYLKRIHHIDVMNQMMEAAERACRYTMFVDSICNISTDDWIWKLNYLRLANECMVEVDATATLIYESLSDIKDISLSWMEPSAKSFGQLIQDSLKRFSALRTKFCDNLGVAAFNEFLDIE